MMRVSLAPLTFRDRRTKEQIGQESARLQAAADQRLEQLWSDRVHENVRRRVDGKVVRLLDRRPKC